MSETTDADDGPELSGHEMDTWLLWQLSPEGGDVPESNVRENTEAMTQIREHFGIDDDADPTSIETLESIEDALGIGEHNSRDRVRLGVMKRRDEIEFVPEVDILAGVEKVSREEAERLIDVFMDIPSMCEAIRTDWLFDELYSTLEYRDEDTDWVEDFNADDLEWRMKQAHAWVEPQNAAAM